MTEVKINDKGMRFIAAIIAEFGEVEMIDRKDIQTVLDKNSSLVWPTWLTANKDLRYGRGQFHFPDKNGKFDLAGINVLKLSTKVKKIAGKNTNVVMTKIEVSPDDAAPTAEVTEYVWSLVPKKNAVFVKWGYFKDIISVFKSGKFYPIFVTGLSGNGKTFMVEQVCAELKRPMYRANITTETDEDDLLGGFRLENGSTVWHDGPVVEAMKAGAILLLDEVDLGTEKLMCLQPVLEGKGIFLKKIGKFIEPAPGFNIVATANTKGKGSDDGQFIGTNVMNEAMIDRFPITLEQPYPDKGVETKILTNSTALDMDVTELEADFINKLVLWGECVRKLYAEGGIDEIITTRRLVHVMNAYSIFGKNRMKAIKMTIARFDGEVKTDLLSFYKKIDETIEQEKQKALEVADPSNKVTPKVPVDDSTDSGTTECPF